MIRSIWDELADLEDRVDEVFRHPVRTAPRLLGPAFERPFLPSTDVYSHNGDLVIELDLPGVDAEKEVKITVEAGDLVVRGERHRETKVERKAFYRMETYEGAFERHIPLPEGIPTGKIAATYNKGILKVVIPEATKKIAATPTTTVPIKVLAK